MKACALLAVSLLVLLAGPPLPEGLSLSSAQAAPRSKGKRKGNRKARPPAVEARESAPATSADVQESADEAPAPAPAPSPAPPRQSKPRVYTFGGLDLEGKLKTPQLLYFRSRMRQELDTSGPQKRSFLKELEKTADDKGL